MKLDILRRCGVIAGAQWKSGKELLGRIVAMLTRMTDHCADQVREEMAVYEYVNEYEYAGEAGSAASAGGVPNKSLHATAGTGPFCRIEAASRARRA